IMCSIDSSSKSEPLACALSRIFEQLKCSGIRRLLQALRCCGSFAYGLSATKQGLTTELSESIIVVVVMLTVAACIGNVDEEEAVLGLSSLCQSSLFHPLRLNLVMIPLYSVSRY